MRKIICQLSCLSLLLLFFSSYALALEDSAYTFKTSQEAYRFQALTKEIRCLVCQNQSIADSNAPLAQDLRQKVYQLITENQADADIKAYLVKRYGEFILLNPRLNKLTGLLWVFPVLCLLIAFGLVLYFIKKQTAR